MYLCSYLGCQRPSSGCYENHDVYANVDCDGDGTLDHACSTTLSNNEWRWLVLSSEGCPSNWGSNDRTVSDCPQAWPDEGNFNMICTLELL